MASSMIKFFSKSVLNPNSYSLFYNVVRHSSARLKVKQKIGTIKNRNIIKSSFESLSARGFLRSLKPYTPPENVTEEVINLCKKVLGSNYSSDSALTREEKFNILAACFYKFNHSVPNSLLHTILNTKDVVEFYNTPISTKNPYEELKNKNLPPNLHLVPDYHRFDPDTDTKFKGITAFPRSSTIVTGLKYRKKYKGNVQKSPYLDNEVTFKKINE